MGIYDMVPNSTERIERVLVAGFLLCQAIDHMRSPSPIKSMAYVIAANTELATTIIANKA